MKLHKIINSSINLLLSVKCPGCGSSLPWGSFPICHACEAELLEELSTSVHYSKNIKKAWSCMDYTPLIRKCIKQFKYYNGRNMINIFEKILSGTITSDFISKNDVDLILPVPIHSSKLRDRGYNQAELIAETVSEILDLPFCSSVLLKTKKTHPQTHLKRKARLNNLKGSFLSVFPEKVASKTILLVDDVITTGATLETCGLELCKSGAKKVYGLTLARTL